MLPVELIQKILSSIDIVDIVGRHVALKKKGSNHLACCPFHSEKSPSFTVSQSKQFYHCFGCGKHGDVIDFLIEHLGITFIDAIKSLADEAGVDIPDEPVADGVQISPGLYGLVKAAAEHYAMELRSSVVAMDYLRARGVEQQSIERFGIGFAGGKDGLKSVFGDCRDARLQEVGLVVRSDDGVKYFDFFRDRIMFPILDAKGRAIAFGGRVTGKSEPKYLNSPDTPLFKKGGELYGFYQGKKEIGRENRVFVVEGYLDVVVLAQHGIGNAVAALGTAVTGVQVQKLLRAADRIVYCFDGDKAGLQAAKKALTNTLPYLKDGKEVSFMFLPSGHDPDSFVREQGVDAFLAAADAANTLAEFFLSFISSGVDESPSGHVKMIESARLLLGSIDRRYAPAILMVLSAALSRRVGVAVSDISSLLQGKPSVKSARAKFDAVAAVSTRRALQCVLSKPSLARLIPEGCPFCGPDAELMSAVLVVIRNAGFEMSGSWLSRAMQDTPQHGGMGLVEADMLHWDEDLDVEAELSGIVERLTKPKTAISFRDLKAGVGNV